MKKIVSMGELLIDFMPHEKGVLLSEVANFEKHAGGAPANVAATVAKLGGQTYFLGQVGTDSFGNYLKDELTRTGVHTEYLVQTDQANTSLAFVSLTKEGERDFIFYRNPGADQLYHPDQLPEEILKDAILHFCSVSLSDFPIKKTHQKAIDIVRKNKGFISFDPNIRLSLWKDHDAYKKTIHTFIPQVDLLKVSEDELLFITGMDDEKQAINSLFQGEVKYIIYTQGAKGSTLFVACHDDAYHMPGFKVDVKDTTGAGDSYIGAFLYQLNLHDMKLNKDNIYDILRFANATAALVTTRLGGMTSVVTVDQVQELLKQ